MIDLIIDELGSGSYPEDDILALEQLRQVSTVIAGELDAGSKIKLLSLAPTLEERLTNALSNTTEFQWGPITTTIGAVCNAALRNINSEAVNLRMNDPQTVDMVNLLFSVSIMTQADIDAINFLSNEIIYPFQAVKLHELREARGKTNLQSIDWAGERFLKIILNDDLYESVFPLVTVTNTVFSGKNIGRGHTAGKIQAAGDYIVDLTGLSGFLIGTTTLSVELGAPQTFTLELIQ